MIRENVSSWDGDLLMMTITAPGKEYGEAWQWNATAAERWKRLRRAGCQHANRHVKGVKSGVLFFGPEYQRRGLLHWHVALGARTPVERNWCNTFVRYCRSNATRYGFGQQSKAGKWGPASSVGEYVTGLARYVSKLGGMRAGYESGEVKGRDWYVSARLTKATGLTMGTMRLRSRWWRATNQWLSLPDLRTLVEMCEAGLTPLPLRI